jgi:hypothetical protein
MHRHGPEGAFVIKKTQSAYGLHMTRVSNPSYTFTGRKASVDLDNRRKQKYKKRANPTPGPGQYIIPSAVGNTANY